MIISKTFPFAEDGEAHKTPAPPPPIMQMMSISHHQRYQGHRMCERLFVSVGPNCSLKTLIFPAQSTVEQPEHTKAAGFHARRAMVTRTSNDANQKRGRQPSQIACLSLNLSLTNAVGASEAAEYTSQRSLLQVFLPTAEDSRAASGSDRLDRRVCAVRLSI